MSMDIRTDDGRDDERGGDSRLGRWAALAGVALVLAAVGGLAWLATDVPSEPGRVSALQQAVRLPSVWSPTEPPPPVIAAAPIAIPASAPEVVPNGYLDVCGVGLVKKSEWDAPARTEAMAAAFDRTRDRVAASLIARGDDTSRALGLALEIRGGQIVRDEVVKCDGADCPDPPDRIESPQAAMARMKANVAARDQLARLAVNTRNAEVYGLAYSTCRFLNDADAGTACRMLSADQWARLDPDNGHLWMEVAVAARERGDRAAVLEAIHRAGQAKRFDSRFGHFAAGLLERLPPDVSDLEAYELAGMMLSAESVSMGGYQVLSAECSAAAVRDANRLQQCSAVAESLWRHGTDVVQLSLAQALGKRVGWSNERLDAMRDERDAMSKAGAMFHEKNGADLSCASLRHQREYMASLGRLGEVGTARALVAATGRPMSELAREARLDHEAATRRLAEARAAQAASAVPLAR